MKLLVFEIMLIVAFGLPALGQVGMPPLEAPAPAASSEPAAAKAGQTQAISGGESPAETLDFPVLRTVGGLGLVLSLIVACYFAARKFAPHYFTKRLSETNVKLIETLPMGEKRSVSLIQVEERRFLLGNTPQQITLLAALPEPISGVSETEMPPASHKSITKKADPFRNLYDVERARLSQNAGKPKMIPEDIRAKMRQLREELER